MLGLAVGDASAATHVEARLLAGQIDAGSATTLLVTVADPGGSIEDPQFAVPGGLELLGTSQSRNFSFINGKASNEVTYRFEIGASAPGRYSIGPVRVTVAGRTYVSGTLPLVVTSPSSRPSGSRGTGPASLVVTAEPMDPYVGQLLRLRVRLVQRVKMADESQYSTPNTPGFWTESWGDPTVYEAREGGRPVLVTERAMRVYPLAPGVATVGQAVATVTPTSTSSGDPFFGQVLLQRPIEISSDSFHVRVRPLPAGAPAGFDGAVGTLEWAWSADRSHTAIDQAITAWLDVRGVGNLPLLRTPKFAPDDFEVFASTVDDSLPPAGQVSPGRRRFSWTLLPRRAGTLTIPAPAVAWLDPVRGRYEQATPAPLTLEVLAGAGAPTSSDGEETFPAALARHPASAGSSRARPWAALLAGVCVGLAVRLWRRTSGPDPHSAERARIAEWLRAVGFAKGPDFWRAADESVAWLENRDVQVLRLREDIAAARYGGETARENDVRRRLIERLSQAMPPVPATGPSRLAAIGLLVAGIALAWWALPHAGDARLTQRSAGADAQARAGRWSAAQAEWSRIWQEAPGEPRLAARLAWAALQQEDVAGAALWVLRGERLEARDPALRWVAERAREAGALVGAPGRGVPLRALEWAALAFVLAFAVVLLWPRMRSSVPLAALALVAAMFAPVERRWTERLPLAVVRAPCTLEGADVQLEAGQVVRIVSLGGERTRVRAGRELVGWVPRDAILPVSSK